MAKKQTQIALLRGINVGGHNRVPMPRLRELLTELGYGDVRTLVQSGNIVLTSSKSPKTLSADLQREIAAEFDVDTPVVVRTRDEIAEVVARDPIGAIATQPKLYQVTFLEGKLPQKSVDKLGELAREDERFFVDGLQVYVWHPGGAARSKLWKLLGGKQLGVVGTSRNWNTVTKLLAMADE
jgi:uncharacterized protein (DUF1697 family)